MHQTPTGVEPTVVDDDDDDDEWLKRRGLAQECAFWRLANLKLIFNVFIQKIPNNYNGAYGNIKQFLKRS